MTAYRTMLKDSWTDHQFSQFVFEDHDTTARFLRDLQDKKVEILWSPCESKQLNKYCNLPELENLRF